MQYRPTQRCFVIEPSRWAARDLRVVYDKRKGPAQFGRPQVRSEHVHAHHACVARIKLSHRGL